MMAFFFSFSFFFNLGSFSYTSVLASYLCGEFILHIRTGIILCGEFPYTSHACFLFLWGVCLTHPQFSLSSWAGFNFMRGVSLTHPCRLLLFFLFNFFISEFLLHILHWLYFSVGSSLTHPMLASFFVVFLFFGLNLEVSLTHPCWLHIYAGSFSYKSRDWLYFYLGSFSYTSLACFLFLWGVCLIHL